MKCVHIVGLIYDYENTQLTTVDGLKRHIRDRLELKNAFETDPFGNKMPRDVKASLRCGIV